MPKINQEEYEVLKGLDDKWKWIARDDNYDASLFCFEDRPCKSMESGTWGPTAVQYNYLGQHDSKFQFIQWEDEEPHNIAELIEEYESEETEVKKDLEWLKEEVEDLQIYTNPQEHYDRSNPYILYVEGVNVTVSRVKELLAQLDELETLSQEWLVKHSYNVHLLGTPDVEAVAVPRDDLEGLLVPKQEITEEQAWEKISEYYPVKQAGLKSAFEHFYYGGFMTDVVAKKPVIPKFVAEWFEENKEHFESKLKSIIKYPPQYNEDVTDFTRWVSNSNNNPLQTLGNMFNGYEVEEEQKYIVMIPHQLNNAFDLYLCETDAAVYFLDKEDEFNGRVKYKFTEEEIKEINPDYMTFAKPVEELEE